MAETADMIIPTLREIRSDIKNGFELLDRRLKALEQAQKSFRQALAADSLLSKLVTGEFEGRIEASARKFAAVEAMK